MMPSPEAQKGSRLPPPCQHVQLANAVAAVVTTVVVTAVEAAVAVIHLQAQFGQKCVGWVDLGRS